MPDLNHRLSSIPETPGVDFSRFFLKGQSMHHHAVTQVGLLEQIGLAIMDDAGLYQGLNQTDIVRPLGKLRMIW